MYFIFAASAKLKTSKTHLLICASLQSLKRASYVNNPVTFLLQGADGVAFGFLNGLEISKNGSVFFTDSSSKWGRRHVRYEVSEGASFSEVKTWKRSHFTCTEVLFSLQVLETNRLGRLLSFDPVTGRVRTLLDSLHMPNGFAFSPDEDFLLLAETSIGRIIK